MGSLLKTNRVKSNYLRIGNETNQNRPLESRKSCSSELSHLDIKMNDVLSYMLDNVQMIAMQVVFINKPVFSDLLCNRCYSESKASFVVATSGSTCSWGSAG
ncbi:hypothetical protein SCLCIDRAFT_1207818 [Scleroderma citrinum Foug A]|uniref:Uncharacterized protein n=1 Tax=Scleroderma citrinum Foug A TaxID=1036808 RepID=A0A0C3EMH4_9AGAM|nr:hypothetical protein SCLCIDRAFT_1207818 [Scleroderma citrinum Foug A]